MRKNYYSDYAIHTITWYARNPEKPEGITDVESRNWDVCDEIAKSLPKRDRQILLYTYRLSYPTFQESVQESANKWLVSPVHIWKIINRFIQTFARKRELI